MNSLGNINDQIKKIVIDAADASIELIRSKEVLINSYLICNCLDEKTPLKKFIDRIEEELIKRTLLLTNGNQRTAASILGIKPTTLNEKIKKFRIGKIRKSQKISNLKTLLTGNQHFLYKKNNS